MKSKLIILVALMLVAATLLASCNAPTNPSDDVAEDIVTETTEAFVEVSPYTVTETLMDPEVNREFYEIYEANSKLTYKSPLPLEAAYVMGNVYYLNNCKLKSITFPVEKTVKLDDEGNFFFTLYIFGSDFAALKTEARRSYEIKVNAAEYGLTANKSKVRKVIKIDLTPYDITLSEEETLGYYSKNDTIIASMLKNTVDNEHAAYKVLREKAMHMMSSFAMAGTGSLDYTHDTLMFDFEWEKTYDKKSEYLAMKNHTEYNKMISELLEKYKGKYVSVVGDSISSFNGLCNDATANVTIANNAPYYPNYNGNLYDYTQMYYGKIIKDLEMQPCVMNCWSASTAYGGGDKKNMLVRVADLHRDNGTPDDPSDDIAPDLVIIYFGINDFHGNSKYDDELLKIISSGYSESQVDAWFKKVKANADKTDVIEAGTTYQNFSQVYALSLNAIKEKYPNAEIICLTMQETNHPNENKVKFQKINNTITALAKYFDAILVNQSEDIITYKTCHAYAGDMSSLHPNPEGHAIMAENIVKAMYEANK